ncbi:MAG: nitrous oxide reductase family maturation protein NosD [Candidatus Hodarchaeota archaeon]
MRNVKKSSIILLGIFVFILGISAYTTIMTVWNTSPNIEVRENNPNGIRDPERPKSSGFWELSEDIFINATATGVDAHNWSWAVSQAWCSGSGTPGSPYLLENITIIINQTANLEYACINITNSKNVYFRISNVTVKNNATGKGIGISCNNCSLGVIVNSNASNNGEHGIEISDSLNITITGDIMHNNTQFGINMDNASRSTVSGVTANNNLEGAWIGNSHNVTVKGGSTFHNNSYGVLIQATSNNSMTSCTVTNNSQVGIAFNSGADYNNITLCNIYNNSNGIGILNNADGNRITSNQIEDNLVVGIGITSAGSPYGNIIYNNTFVTNSINGQDNSTGANYWDDGVSLGNDWDDAFESQGIVDLDDDGIGDTPYNISGTANRQDRYPIMEDGDDTAPAITIVDPKANIIYTHIPRFSLTIVEAVGIYNRWYTLDGGVNNITFTGTTGTINTTEWERITGLPGETPSLVIVFYINDTSGNIGSASVKLYKLIPESVEHGEPSEDVYMYALTKNQIYVLLAFSFSLSLILRLITLRTKKR